MVQNTAATRIYGTLKGRMAKDIFVSFGLGIPLAYAWWYSFHVPRQQQREAWYIDYAQKRKVAEE